LKEKCDIHHQELYGGLLLALKIPETTISPEVFRNIELLTRTEGLDVTAGTKAVPSVKKPATDQVQKSLLSEFKRVTAEFALEIEQIKSITQAIDEEMPPMADGLTSVPSQATPPEDTGSAGPLQRLYNTVVNTARSHIDSLDVVRGESSELLPMPEKEQNRVSEGISGSWLEKFLSSFEKSQVRSEPAADPAATATVTASALTTASATTTEPAIVATPATETETATATAKTKATIGTAAFEKNMTAGRPGQTPVISGIASPGPQTPDLDITKGPDAIPSSPGSHEVPQAVPDDEIISRTMRFVEDVNALVSEDTPSEQEGAQNESARGRSIDAGPVIKAGAKISADKLGIHGTIRNILADETTSQIGKSVGIYVKDNGLLQLDTSSLSTSLSSHKEIALTSLRDFSDSLSQKIDYLANLYIGSVVYGKAMALAHSVHGMQKAPSAEQEPTAEQNALNERLKELKVLIDQSTVLRDWLAHKTQDSTIEVEADV
jgi:hypothetical protein